MISVTLVFVYSDTILLVWIGDEYTYLSVYMQAMVFHLGVTQSVRQISTMNTAYNKMKTSGLVTVLFGCFHICASIILLKYTSFTLLAVILSNLFFSILLNIIFLPLFVSNYLKESVTRIYKNIYPILLTQIIVLISSYSTKYLILPNDAFSLAFSIALSFTAALVLVYLLILTEQERHFVMAYYRRFLN